MVKPVSDPDFPWTGIFFGAPILGIVFVNPPSKITIVDSVTLTAVFFDAAGNPIQTGTKREYRFVSNSPVLRLRPERAEVDAGAAARIRRFLATVKDTCCGCRRVIYPGDFIVILPDARVCHVPRCGTAVAVSVPLDVEDEQA